MLENAHGQQGFPVILPTGAHTPSVFSNSLSLVWCPSSNLQQNQKLGKITAASFYDGTINNPTCFSQNALHCVLENNLKHNFAEVTFICKIANHFNLWNGVFANTFREIVWVAQRHTVIRAEMGAETDYNINTFSNTSWSRARSGVFDFWHRGTVALGQDVQSEKVKDHSTA